MKKPRYILFYNTMFDVPLTYPEEDIPEEFELTTDRKHMHDAVAIVFHLPSLQFPFFNNISRHIPLLRQISLRYKRLRKMKGQLWVAWFMECEVNYPHFSDPSYMNSFDLTMSHHLDSDIVVPYYYYDLNELLRGTIREKEVGKSVCAFISSSFHKSGRLEYLKTLVNYLDVQSYGKVLRNRVIKRDTGHRSKMDTIAQYKFTIAFENAIARDYVTEKFYDPLIAGSVPIYLGAPNIEDFAPGDRCFINVSDWDGPESLARYILELSEDEALYQAYFDWKSKPFKPNFARMLEQQKEHAFVRLCKKIQENGSRLKRKAFIS